MSSRLAPSTTTELPPVAAKGKSEPVAAWLAKAPIARLGIGLGRERLTPLVDREAELAYLTSLFDKAVGSSSPAVALIVGEPGIGKSRLVAELFAARRRAPRAHHLAPGPLPLLR